MLLNKYTKANGQIVHNVDSDSLLEIGESQNDIDAAILVEYKKEQRIAVNAIRNSRINAGVEFPVDSGDVYDSDDTAQKNINGAVTMYSLAVGAGAGDDFEQQWIKLDGEIQVLDGAGVTGLGMTLGKHVGSHRVEAAEHKKQIESAEDKDAVDAVVTAYAALS